MIQYSDLFLVGADISLVGANVFLVGADLFSVGASHIFGWVVFKFAVGVILILGRGVLNSR